MKQRYSSGEGWFLAAITCIFVSVLTLIGLFSYIVVHFIRKFW